MGANSGCDRMRSLPRGAAGRRVGCSLTTWRWVWQVLKGKAAPLDIQNVDTVRVIAHQGGASTD